MAITDRKPTGLLRALLRAPIWLYRMRLGRLAGRRLTYIAHLGRRTGARREVVVETVRFDPATPEIVVVAAWGPGPDWYRNLLAAPAIEVRVGGQRWPRPRHRLLDADETQRTLLAYQRNHPHAWKRLGPLLGFPTDSADPHWPDVAASVHAIAFRPSRDG
ncbi:nitroreductase family deazaflavin-dependent oxidoreductase [Actinophytocola sp.]|uniref:nitroreductase family deazaflavin-dependent oxidoreductase n=1 Tax=Actinophytocola sp. TaxID=1872138 RepID=UPI003D6ACD96